MVEPSSSQNPTMMDRVGQSAQRRVKSEMNKATISMVTKVEGRPLPNIHMKCVKTINNWSDQRNDKNEKTMTCVNAVQWNYCPQFSNQFITVDDLSRITLYNTSKDTPIVQEPVSHGLLACAAIEPRQGQLILSGGIETKLWVHSINKKVQRRETAKLITK